MNFTARGQRNSLVHFKYNQNGGNQEETVVDVVFMIEIIGAWQGSKAVRPIRIVHIEPQSQELVNAKYCEGQSRKWYYY